MSEQNEALARRWIDEMCGRHDLSVGDEIFSPDLVDHNPAPGQASGPEGQKQVLRELWAGFPDFHSVAEDVFSTQDRVAVRWSARGTHLGEYYGLAPTGRQMTYSGIDILRVENGKIVERWGSSDDLGLLQQLGQYGVP